MTTSLGTSENGALQPIRMVQFIPEPKTTFRADIAALFGRYLPRNGIECELIGAQQQHSAVLAGSGESNPNLAHQSRLGKAVAYWHVCWKRLAATDRSNCDLIQVRDQVTLGWLALCMARIKGIPFCFWMSFLMSEARVLVARDKLRQRFGLFQCMVWLRGTVEEFVLYRLVLPFCDHVFVQSDAMAAYVHSRGIAADRISAVPMGVDLEQLGDDFKARLVGTESIPEPVLAYLGTLIAPRNIETLVDTLVLVRMDWPGARLKLIGSSDSTDSNQRLLNYAAHCGLADAVEITGWLPTAQAWKILKQADVALSWIPRSLFHDVSSPTKLLEYLALGIPCVGNDIPDQVAVLEASRAGWLCESSAVAMATAVNEILRDPVAARKRAAGGPAYIEAVRSYQVISNNVAQRYRSIVK